MIKRAYTEAISRFLEIKLESVVSSSNMKGVLVSFSKVSMITLFRIKQTSYFPPLQPRHIPNFIFRCTGLKGNGDRLCL